MAGPRRSAGEVWQDGVLTAVVAIMLGIVVAPLSNTIPGPGLPEPLYAADIAAVAMVFAAAVLLACGQLAVSTVAFGTATLVLVGQDSRGGRQHIAGEFPLHALHTWRTGRRS